MPPPADNLPAVPADTFGDQDANLPLSQAPTPALAFALGYAAARPVAANQFGPFCAIVEQLMDRDQWAPLMATLPPGMGRALAMLYQAQRGQRWAQTGQNRQRRESR